MKGFYASTWIHFSALVFVGLFMSCENPKAENLEEAKSSNTAYLDYIRKVEGVDEELDPQLIKKGEVLISYADCGNCHSLEKRGKGPAFYDIALRYPSNQVYVSLLSRKIINGGFGSWGNPVMEPHPDLRIEEAEAMIVYILSLEESG